MTSIKDIAFIAGLLEGEGCFLFQNSPSIQLNMTDEDVITKFRSIISSECKIQVRSPKSINYKTSYAIYIKGTLAIQWMMTIYPLMGRRRKEKLREVIKSWKEMAGYGEARQTNLAKGRLVTTLAKARGISIKEAGKIIENTFTVS